MDAIREMLDRLAARDQWTLAMYGHETYPRLLPGENLWSATNHWSRKTLNWPLQGFMADMTAEYKPPHWHTSLIEWVETESSRALGISPELLLGQLVPTAVEMELKMEVTKNELEPYFKAAREAFEPKAGPWVVEDYVLVYLRKRPHIILSGITDTGYMVETAPKRFSSSRRARQWARSQLNIMFYTISIGKFGSSIRIEL